MNLTEPHSGEIEPKRLDDFAQRLAAQPERHLSAQTLWTVFVEAFPHRPRGTEPRRWMLAALRHVEAQGVIKIPSAHGRRWDRDFDPHIPKSVDRIARPKPLSEKRWRLFPWHARLHWVADLLKLAPDQEFFCSAYIKGSSIVSSYNWLR